MRVLKINFDSFGVIRRCNSAFVYANGRIDGLKCKERRVLDTGSAHLFCLSFSYLDYGGDHRHSRGIELETLLF